MSIPILLFSLGLFFLIKFKFLYGRRKHCYFLKLVPLLCLNPLNFCELKAAGGWKTWSCPAVQSLAHGLQRRDDNWGFRTERGREEREREGKQIHCDLCHVTTNYSFDKIIFVHWCRPVLTPERKVCVHCFIAKLHL